MPDIHPFLKQMADTLCDEVAGGGPNSLMHVKEADDGIDVGLLPLDGKHPTAVLMGTVAPPDWLALGVVSRGKPHDLDGDRRRKLPATATSAVFVHRDGTVIGRVLVGDLVIDDPPAYGLTLDCLQRALGLPTAPPLVGTGVRFTSMWLEKMLIAAEILPASQLTWTIAAALHPVWEILGDESPAGTARAAELLAAARAMERVCDWERLRWLTVEGRWHEPYVSPVDAAWLDAGSFSRLVMTDALPVHTGLAELRRAAGAGIARRCRAVVNTLGHHSGRTAA